MYKQLTGVDDTRETSPLLRNMYLNLKNFFYLEDVVNNKYYGWVFHLVLLMQVEFEER